MAELRESNIENYFGRQAKKRGGSVRKVKWIGRRNAPDRLLLMPGWSCFVEVKRPGEEPTAAQFRELHRLRAAGQNAEWVDSELAVQQLFATKGEGMGM